MPFLTLLLTVAGCLFRYSWKSLLPVPVKSQADFEANKRIPSETGAHALEGCRHIWWAWGRRNLCIHLFVVHHRSLPVQAPFAVLWQAIHNEAVSRHTCQRRPAGPSHGVALICMSVACFSSGCSRTTDEGEATIISFFTRSARMCVSVRACAPGRAHASV